MPSLTIEQKSCSNFVKYPSDCGRDWTKTKGRNLEIFWFNECLNCYLHWLENILLQPQNSTYKGRNVKFHSERYTLRRKSSFKLFFQCHGCSKKSVKGNFVLKNSRKIGKSIVLSPTPVIRLLAPHRGYNKGYESSASTFARFRSTFAA